MTRHSILKISTSKMGQEPRLPLGGPARHFFSSQSQPVSLDSHPIKTSVQETTWLTDYKWRMTVMLSYTHIQTQCSTERNHANLHHQDRWKQIFLDYTVVWGGCLCVFRFGGKRSICAGKRRAVIMSRRWSPGLEEGSPGAHRQACTPLHRMLGKQGPGSQPLPMGLVSAQDVTEHADTHKTVSSMW